MLKKTYNQSDQTYQVTFILPAEAQAESACLCGNFNAWDHGAHPMNRQADGSFEITLTLEADHHYLFRYFLNGDRWENDWQADAYTPNPFGSDDSVLNLEAVIE